MTAKGTGATPKDTPRTGRDSDDIANSITLLVVGLCVAAIMATALIALAR